MVSCGLQNLNGTFCGTSKPLNMIESRFLMIFLVLNTLFLLFFAVWLLIASVANILSHFNLDKHHLHFGFSCLTGANIFYCLFWGFQTVQKCTFYFPATTLTFKNITITFFVVCFSLNLSFVPFSSIFTWKCINHSYLLSVYTLDTPNTG